ncbi:MAG: hypothetical protein ACYDIA_24610 [Candidatus Humimicrobiaceae bacterium]
MNSAAERKRQKLNEQQVLTKLYWRTSPGMAAHTTGGARMQKISGTLYNS